MKSESSQINAQAVQAGGQLNLFEKYLTLWVALCIIAGIALGKTFPGVAQTLDAMSVHNVSIPIAICLFFMMYPIMVKIDFYQAKKADKSPKTVLLTLVIKWMVKPYKMVLFAQFFIGWLCQSFLS